ncbi:aminodeoxychorismate synthase component I [Alcanivorax jadensis]|uniref:aminodeoxychorismate synthase component I n=1 Tax=Alcanivorax jadensis TaxID=64988 RepID=UPI002355303A|nr:aminodeoxychorismate synthase component I [Alcanivorax jadensis]
MMSLSCLFYSTDGLVALNRPDLTLSADNAADLVRCAAETEKALAGGYAFAAGVLPYEAGAWLRGVNRFSSVKGNGMHDHSVVPAVIHLYKGLPAPVRGSSAAPTGEFILGGAFRAEQGREKYLHSLGRIKDYLSAGDCYQVNLAQRFSAHFKGDPLTAWLALQAAHPAPHSCFFDAGGSQIFGVSPERFLSIRDRQVVTEPIKGSRPRGATPEEDQAFGDELLSNPKDRAENLMIVDLLRNDLGACCEPGSIQADPLFELRRFSNVQHLVSTVTGTLRRDLSPLDALLGAFPGGSITGAPKKRAMEIIAELEPVPRGAYCGSFFWMDNQGNLDSNILIRTLQTEGDRLYCHGGGGIVFDSVPEAEYEESCFKVAKLMGALEERFL